MRTLIVYRNPDRTQMRHVDLDDNTAIGITVTLFDPQHPDVAKVNSSNEFTIPMTRNNREIFDNIFDPSHNEDIQTDYDYDCDYFVDNHRMISGKVYLTGTEDGRIKMFIYDKTNIIAKLKQYSFGQFEKDYLSEAYYDYSDWPEYKVPSLISSKAGDDGSVVNLFPNKDNSSTYDTDKGLFKEMALSLVSGMRNYSLDEVKTGLRKFVDELDPLRNIATLWNATISKLNMDFCNFTTPYLSQQSIKGYGCKNSNGSYSSPPVVNAIWNIYDDSMAEKRRTIMDGYGIEGLLGIPYFTLGCEVINGVMTPANMYIGGYPLGERKRGIRAGSWTFDYSLRNHPAMTYDETNLIQKETDLREKLQTIRRIYDKYTYAMKGGPGNRSNYMTNHYSAVWCRCIYTQDIVGFSDGYFNLDENNGQPDLWRYLGDMLTIMENIVNSSDPSFGAGDATVRKSQLYSIIDSMTSSNYTQKRAEFDALITGAKGYDELWGTKAVDGVSIYTLDDNQIAGTYPADIYQASADMITGAPSLNITQASTLSNFNAWRQGEQTYLDQVRAVLASDQAKISTIPPSKIALANYMRTGSATRPPLAYFPTSVSSEDTTIYTGSYVTSINLNAMKLDGETKKYNGGSLYASTTNILEFLSSKLGYSIKLEPEELDYLMGWFTNLPDINIVKDSSEWYWDYIEQGDDSNIKSPASKKNMYDWLMMVCRTHSIVPVVDTNYYRYDSATGTAYTGKLYFKPYGKDYPLSMDNEHRFDLMVDGSTKWLGCGDFSSSVNTIEFESTEEGTEKEIAKITIQNQSLSDDKSTMYTTGSHRMSSFYPSSLTQMLKTGGSDNFQYINVRQVDAGDDVQFYCEIELNIIFGNETFTPYWFDFIEDGITYSPRLPYPLPEGNTQEKYFYQSSVDIDLLHNLLEPYPVVYELQTYASFSELYSIFFNGFDVNKVFWFPELNGYYYITKVSGINGYNRKQPVTLTLYKYRVN